LWPSGLEPDGERSVPCICTDSVEFVNFSLSPVISQPASCVSDHVEVPCVCDSDFQHAELAQTKGLSECNGETSSSTERLSPCNATLAMFAELTAGLKPNHLLFLTCRRTGIKFCVDTGSCINIIKPSDLPQNATVTSSNVKVYGVGNNHARAQGEVRLHLHCGELPDVKSTTCVVANTPLNLLGFPYVCEHGFEQLQRFATIESVDDHVALLAHLEQNNAVMSYAEACDFVLQFTFDELSTVAPEQLLTSQEIQSLWDAFPSVLKEPDYHAPSKMPFKHEIHTGDAPPVRAKRFAMSPFMAARMQEEIDKLEKMGLFERGVSAWGSPAFLVKKSQPGQFRLVQDHRKINSVTKDSEYSLPRLEDAQVITQGRKIFSCLDLTMGFYNIELREEDREKCAIVTSSGLYLPKRLQMGLKCASASMMYNLHAILSDALGKFCFAYIDDILISSYNKAEHIQQVKWVLQVLDQYDLRVKSSKCKLGLSRIEFLGSIIDGQGIEPTKERLNHILKLPLPRTVRALRKALGAINFVRKHLPNFAQVVNPLEQLVGGISKQDAPRTDIRWTQRLCSHWVMTKWLLARAIKLHSLRVDLPIHVTTDASSFGLGACLFQTRDVRSTDGDVYPVAFMSKALTPKQAISSAFDLELMALFFGLRTFQPLLELASFTIWSDHQPLIKALRNPREVVSTVNRRRLTFVSMFNANYEYLSGADNCLADYLSRIYEDQLPPKGLSDYPVALMNKLAREGKILIEEHEAVELVDELPCLFAADLNESDFSVDAFFGTLNFPTVANLTIHDRPLDIQALAREQVQHIHLILQWPASRQLDLLSDEDRHISLWGKTGPDHHFRVWVPPTFRQQVFDYVHGLGHTGAKNTYKLMKAYFYWHTMRGDVRLLQRTCLQCQRLRVHRKTVSPLQSYQPAIQKFSHIHMDVLSLWRDPVTGRSSVLTIVDRFTRLFHAEPLNDSTSYSVVMAFLRGFVCHYGIASSCCTDNAQYFLSALFKSVMKALNIYHHTVTAYHPQASGIIERPHGTLLSLLRGRTNVAHWEENLPLALLQMKVMHKVDSQYTVAEAVFGMQLELPLRMIAPQPPDEHIAPVAFRLAQFMDELQPVVTREVSHGSRRSFLPPELQTCTHVFVHNSHAHDKRLPPYQGPFRVLMSFLKWLLIRRGARIEKVSVDRVIPARMIVNPEGSGDTLGRHPVRAQPRGPSADLYDSLTDAVPPNRSLLTEDQPSNSLQSFGDYQRPPAAPVASHHASPNDSSRAGEGASRAQHGASDLRLPPSGPIVTRYGRKIHKPARYND